MEICNTILKLIKNIHTALDELYDGSTCTHAEQNTSGAEEMDVHTKRLISNDFLLGQAYAYVECLEILQKCAQLRMLGLDYDIESRYPLT